MTQNWIVGALVGLAALYSLWFVMPAALRRRLGGLHRALAQAPGCASSCGSCGKCPGSAAPRAMALGPQEQPISFHRRDD
jgi:hypothetical protein